MCHKAIAKQNYVATGKLPPLIAARLYLVNFDTDQRKPWFIKALRADGQPLTFGYEVNDIHGHNIGVVGQGSQLFIRTNEVPPSVNVAIDKQQGLSCTITFGKEIDESRNYICQ